MGFVDGREDLQVMKRFVITLIVGAGALLAVACGAAATSGNSGNVPPISGVPNTTASVPASPSAPGSAASAVAATVAAPTPAPTPDLLAVPRLNTDIAKVPLEEILFDTFGRTASRFVRLSDAEQDLIVGLRDAIPPIYQPVYAGPDSLPWLRDDSLIIGYVSGSKAFAYPINILNLHELVNDEIDGKPVLITYCPLCASGVVYSRELAGDALVFGNTSALYQSDLVMFDYSTGSYWFQVAGEAVVGELTGSKLQLLPSTTMFWSEWKLLHPETSLLTGVAAEPERFQRPRYARQVFAGYQKRVNDGKFAFPVDDDKLDDRLDAGDLVLTVEIGDSVTAYPLDRIGNGVVNDVVGDAAVVVFSSENSRAVGAFSRVINGQTLSFEYLSDSQIIVDRETNSSWDVSGFAVEGPLSGSKLEPLNTRRAYWFSIAIAFPEVELHTP